MDKTVLAIFLPLWILFFVLPGNVGCGQTASIWTVTWTLLLTIGGAVAVERYAGKPLSWPTLRRGSGEAEYAVEFEDEIGGVWSDDD